MESKNSILATLTVNKESMKFCGVITCINCVNQSCTTDKCDLYEESFSQEG